MHKLTLLVSAAVLTLSSFSQAKDMAHIYPILKDFDWEAKQQAVNQSFLGINQAPVPVIAYGFETDKNYQFLSNKALAESKLDELHSNAVSNLCSKEFKFEELFEFGLTASGDSFSAEMILCKNFLLAAEERLGTKEILVAVPRRSVIYVAKKAMTEAESNKFFYLVSYTYQDDSLVNASITNLVFGYKGIENTSIFKVQESEPAVTARSKTLN